MKSEEVDSILVVAHELKAPLSLLRQLAFSMDLTADESSRRCISNQMITVSERALRQVNDLTKIAHLEDGLFEMTPVSVRGVCDEVLREILPLSRHEKRNLHFAYNNKSRLAIANHELLYSIIYNFCTNAIRYSDAETQSLLTIADVSSAHSVASRTDKTHSAAPCSVTSCHVASHPTTSSKDRIRISIRDFGPALPVQVWRQVRRGFIDRPMSVARRPGSSGLGLYISSQFAKHMNAELGAIRHRDGTSFYVELPISEQASLFHE